MSARTSLEAFVIETLKALQAEDIKVLDVRAQSAFTDTMVLATGRSTTHVRSIVGNIVRRSKTTRRKIYGTEGLNSADWVLVDLGDLVVHVMREEARSFYDLERLWSVIETDSQSG